MKRIDLIKNMTIDEMAKFVCDIVESAAGELALDVEELCNNCPAGQYCRSEHNGFVDWLNEEVEDEDCD